METLHKLFHGVQCSAHLLQAGPPAIREHVVTCWVGRGPGEGLAAATGGGTEALVDHELHVALAKDLLHGHGRNCDGPLRAAAGSPCQVHSRGQ